MDNSPTNLLLCKENSITAEFLHDSYDDEYIKLLLDKETAYPVQDSLRIQDARLEGINYILRKRQLFGFEYHTAYLSITYLDRFLSIKNVEKPWAVRLLAMGCLSLAAKMVEKRVPLLSELSVGDYLFDTSVIQKMELLVLNTFGWKMGAITPFHFIPFFRDKFRNASGNAFLMTAQVISDAIRDVKMMGHRASVVAAAATLFVLDQGLKRDTLELKISPLNATHSFNIESIISCYGLLQDIGRRKLSKGSAKRKRLVFNQDYKLNNLANS